MNGRTLVITVAAAAALACTGAPAAAAQTKAAGTPRPGAEARAQHEKAETSPKVQAQLNKLPAAVRATVEAETRNATIKAVSSEKENGKTVYELESLVNGRTRDLMIDAAGKVYSVEEQLDVASAPAAVKAALEARGKVVALESVLENGRHHYEGQVRTAAGKTVSMDLDSDGRPAKK